MITHKLYSRAYHHCLKWDITMMLQNAQKFAEMQMLKLTFLSSVFPRVYKSLKQQNTQVQERVWLGRWRRIICLCENVSPQGLSAFPGDKYSCKI